VTAANNRETTTLDPPASDPEHPSCIATDVSVLINNADISRGTSVLDPDTSRLRDELETNLFGPLAMASTFADRIAGGSGVIVNVVVDLDLDDGLVDPHVDACRRELRGVEGGDVERHRFDAHRTCPRGVPVVGVYVGLVDTDMSKFTDYPKSDPVDVIRQVLDGIESGADEVLADEMPRVVRAQLGKPIHARSGGMTQANF
jgi:hypothetical protein